MNQIIFSEHENVKDIKKSRGKFFKFLLYMSIVLIFCVTFYFLYSSYILNEKERISKNLLNTFNLEHLYSSNSNYTVITLNNNSNEKYFVIGTIEISSISINYPILSDTNDELLKIAPCKFYGPYPNEIGNLCIAGHNYDNNQFFSNLHKLNIGDEIRIYNSSNFLTKYYVYSKYETNKNDTSCTSQNTNGNKEITLVTCNNLNGNRLIIKAKNNNKKGYY